MINEIKIIVIIEILILYILVSISYKIYKKEQIENEKRMQILEKRINDNTQLIKLEVKGVFNYIDLMLKGKKRRNE